MNNRKKTKLILAPMAGITDLAFRLICLENGADQVYSEMISVSGIFHENRNKSLELALSCQQDSPLFLQLFGNNPLHFAKSTELISNLPSKENHLSSNKHSLYRPEGIDINFGCPVPKVFKQQSGCYLMNEPEKARQIIKATLDNTPLPVSIKIRAGIGKIDALEFLRHLEDLNWKTAMIHGRTYKEGFSGEINFELIKRIKDYFPEKIVIANGGIFNPEKALETLEKTGADGLAIARGAYGNPWIFQQTKDYLYSGKYEKPSIEEIKKTARKHCQFLLDLKGEAGIKEARKHLMWYFKGLSSAKKIRQSLLSVENLTDVKEVINQIES